MKKQDFLSKLNEEGKLELVEPSEEVCSAYLEKASNCLKSAKLLLENELLENSVSMSYYAMYNSVTALLFKSGIKCENHTGAILLLNKAFARTDLSRIISFAKKERIDKQYYVNSKQNLSLTVQSAKDLATQAENFIIQVRLLIANLTNDNIKNIREGIK